MFINFFYFLKFFLIKKTYSYCNEYFYFNIINYIKINNFEIIKNRNVLNLIFLLNKTTNIFISHLDVVKEGYCKWIKPIFTCICYKKKIFCRGVVDMKGGICSFLYLFKKKNFIITNDEENLSIFGVQYVINILKKRNFKIKLFYSGEPTSEIEIGDLIKISRRGSYNLILIFIGKQKHCAYIGKNIINFSLKKINTIIKKINQKEIFEINNIFSVSNLNNLTPVNCFIKINYRFLIYKNIILFKKKIFLLFKKKNNYFKWVFSGLPFYCYKNYYLKLLFNIIYSIQKIYSKINFFGGTSDLRYCNYFYKNSNYFELGLINKTIHKLNEFSNLDNVYLLYIIYKLFNNGIK